MGILIALAFLFLTSVHGDTGPSDYAELDPARDAASPLLPGSSGAEVVALQNALAGKTLSIVLNERVCYCRKYFRSIPPGTPV